MFPIIRTQDSDASLKANVFTNKLDLTSVKFSIETLVEEIKVVLTLKDEFDYGDKSM